MRDQGIGSWIERRARIDPTRPAVIFGDAVHTYAALATRITRLANGLRGIGVRRGDRVCWLGPNHPAFLEALFASAKLGAVLAPVNHRLDGKTLQHVLEDCSPRVLITHGNVDVPLLPMSVQSRLNIGLDYETLLSASPDEPIDEPIGLADLCMLPFTSGTTGRPKGVMLTHGNITWNVVNVYSRADFRSDDVTIALAPFFRVGGTGINVLPTLFKGGTVVVPETAGADHILGLFERHRATVGFGNPDLLEALTRSPHWPGADLSSIRFILTGGAPVPEHLVHVYRDRGVLLLQGYGLSEAAPVVLILDPVTARRKPEAAGKPVLLDDIRVVDADGSDCKPGETGELLVNGLNIMAGYWQRPEATRAAIDGAGWLHTGDAARLDEDGDVWIVDRMEDRYVSSGHIVYPGEVEAVLVRHGRVADAAVVGTGVNGTSAGVGFAVVDPPGSASPDELLAFCREYLPEYAVPASISLVERIPRTIVGKIARSALRALVE